MGSKSYEEKLLDDKKDVDENIENWVSVVYQDTAIAYQELSDNDRELLQNGSQIQNYEEFLIQLELNRTDLDSALNCLDSYNIAEEAYEVSPGVMHHFAGDDFERIIDREVKDRFEQRDSQGQTGEIGDEFDMLFEGMDVIMTSLLKGRIEEFKEDMDRGELVGNSKVIYGETLEDMFVQIEEFQREY